MTELEMLEVDWKRCERCPLGLTAKRHVLYEADFSPEIGADIMLVGEAPGSSEDTLGRPFVGPSGRLLRQALAEAGAGDLRVLYTNLLACRPTENLGFGKKDRPPAEDEKQACHPRLELIASLFRPKLIVAVGREAEAWLPTEFLRTREARESTEWGAITHPSAIARRGGDTSPNWAPYVKRIQGLCVAARRLRGG